VIPNVTFQFETGIRRFDSSREVRLFLKQLLESYEKSRDLIDAVSGEILRNGRLPEQAQSKGWFKVGNLFLNKTDPTRAGLDIMFQILRETRPKISALEEALKAIGRFEEFTIPEKTAFLLYLRDGIPERIVVGEAASPKEAEEKPGA
jgi:hypothetical protein